MKTETEIAKENVKEVLNKFDENGIYWIINKDNFNEFDLDELRRDLEDSEFLLFCIKEHLASCKRFLEFLEGECNIRFRDEEDADSMGFKKEFNKVKDLQKAIKIYKEAGIE